MMQDGASELVDRQHAMSEASEEKLREGLCNLIKQDLVALKNEFEHPRTDPHRKEQEEDDDAKHSFDKVDDNDQE